MSSGSSWTLTGSAVPMWICCYRMSFTVQIHSTITKHQYAVDENRLTYTIHSHSGSFKYKFEPHSKNKSAT